MRQHRVVSRKQLFDLGYSDDAIQHRLKKGRLFIVFRSVYAVGSPDLTQRGKWMAAVLACGEGAVLSHDSAAQLWGIRPISEGSIHVSGALRRSCSVPGIRYHRRTELKTTTREGIPVTTPVDTLLDVAVQTSERELEALINEAAKLALVAPKQLHREAQAAGRRPGAAAIRKLLDTQTLRLTDSELERMFLRITRRAKLPSPLTQARVGGFRVDFYWPDQRLIVETRRGHLPQDAEPADARPTTRPGPDRRRLRRDPFHACTGRARRHGCCRHA